MKGADPPRTEEDIDWSLTSWEGSRREQLRRWAELPLDRAIMALEEMEALFRNLEAVPSSVPEVREPPVAYGRDAAPCDLPLAGCTPEPLMAYLKALGVLRLVSEQKDERVRGWWRNDVFWLRSPVLFGGKDTDKEKQDALIEFFLVKYTPTPLLAPWNAGSGFYLKWDEKKTAFKQREATDALSRIESSTANRFQPYRDQIQAVKKSLKTSAKVVDPSKQIAEVRTRGQREGWNKRKTDAEVKKLLDNQMLLSADGAILAMERSDKDALVLRNRSRLLHDASLRWIDAAFVIRTGQEKNRTEAPLLGTGGNIGNSDFSARFIQTLISCIPFAGGETSTDESTRLLRNSLLGGPVPGLSGLAVDQFDPGRAGGANMTQGMEGEPQLNPWDYVLMLEGAVVLRSASSKRFGAGSTGSSFPFAVDSTEAGFATSGPDITRGEQWLPLWHRASTAAEIEALLAEGRSELGRRRARSGVEFARAAVSLGVDRGIRQFVRIQYQARFGDNYLANVLGRVDTSSQEAVDLLHQIDPWLVHFRSGCAAENAPARFGRTLRRIDSAVFDFCRYGGPSFFQQILVALGRAERELTTAEHFRDKQKIRPLAGLSAAWLAASNDGSPEFTVALALASVHDPENKIGPIRANLEAVDWKKHNRAWAEKDRAVVWNAADLATNLASALQRRVMDGDRAGCERLPLESSFAVPLDTIAAFIAGRLDDALIESLVWGLVLVDLRRQGDQKKIVPASPADLLTLPRDYALLKLLFLPRPLVPERIGDKVRWRLARRMHDGQVEPGIVIRPEQRLLALLRAGGVGEACRIAARRLRVSGLLPMPGPLTTGAMRDDNWSDRSSDHRSVRRLAPALLIPISSSSVNDLIHSVCRDMSAAAEALAVSSEGETGP